MTNARRPRLTLLLLAIALAGVGLPAVAWIARSLHQADNDWQLSGLMKLGSPPQPNAAWVEMVAQHDFACFSYGSWGSPAMQQAAKDIRRQNLDIHLGTYVHAFTAPWWCKQAAEQGQTGWLAKWWIAMSPYLARTVDGDTAAIYMNNFCFNVLLPEARAAAIGQLQEYVGATGITWAMLDFISVPLKSFEIQGFAVRDPDFDLNGIACKDDQGEQALLRAAWFSYVREMRAALGDDFRLIPNGTLALYDPRFSLEVDGAYVENFPTWFYGDGTTPNFSNALDPAFGPQALPNLCAPGRWARTPGFVMIEDRYDRGSYGLVAAMFEGCVEMRRSSNDIVYPRDPIDLLYLGAPLAPAVPGWSRAFEHGLINLEPAGARLHYAIERTEP